MALSSVVALTSICSSSFEEPTAKEKRKKHPCLAPPVRMLRYLRSKPTVDLKHCQQYRVQKPLPMIFYQAIVHKNKSRWHSLDGHNISKASISTNMFCGVFSEGLVHFFLTPRRFVDNFKSYHRTSLVSTPIQVDFSEDTFFNSTALSQQCQTIPNSQLNPNGFFFSRRFAF